VTSEQLLTPFPTLHYARFGGGGKILVKLCHLLPQTDDDRKAKNWRRTITDKFQRVWNAAARVVSGTRKFARGLSQLLHSELHWLVIPKRAQY